MKTSTLKYSGIDRKFILEWYHVMFLMLNMISMHFTLGTMVQFAGIIPGKDRQIISQQIIYQFYFFTTRL